MSLYHNLCNLLALSQTFAGLESTPDVYLIDVIVLKGQEKSGLILKVKCFIFKFLSFFYHLSLAFKKLV